MTGFDVDVTAWLKRREQATATCSTLLVRVFEARGWRGLVGVVIWLAGGDPVAVAERLRVAEAITRRSDGSRVH